MSTKTQHHIAPRNLKRNVRSTRNNVEEALEVERWSVNRRRAISAWHLVLAKRLDANKPVRRSDLEDNIEVVVQQGKA